MKTKLQISALMLALLNFANAGGPRCVAKFDHGIGVGLLKETFTNRLYCAYLGIPYAQPPLGELRFEDPVPFVFDGSARFDQVANSCVQDLNGRIVGSEDCLGLNVYTTYVRVSKRPRPIMPVLVWIHGGSFTEGSSETDIYGPEFLLDEDVIVVTFNYRLASFGFLGVDDLDISPNLGLRDQTEALRWVSRNIRRFGGDPRRVTLVGWSAGSAAATYHLYSEASKGLFQRVIAMSGTMSQPWAYNFKAEWCSNQYLKQIDATTKEELKARPAKFMVPIDGLKFYYFTVSYECYMPSGDPIYAPRNAYELVRTMAPVSDVPLLVGSTAVEHQNLFNQRRFDMAQSNYPNDNATTYERLVDYLERRRGGNRTAATFYRKLASFADFSYGLQFFVEHASRHFRAPIYRYQFAFDGPFGYAKNVYYRSSIAHRMAGAMHGDDLGYLFTPYNYRSLVTEGRLNDSLIRRSVKTQRRMVRLWTNFIKTGNPTPNNGRINQTIWHPYNDRTNPQQARKYLNIDRRLRLVRDKVPANYYFRLWRTVFDCLYYFECDFLYDGDVERDNGDKK
ncbi:esterase B1-like [Culex pipiens pallens]|uniref:esterase B1-like n=1 Tax=Culex pipiens pallens TaxID=42434 RepID=UPI001953ED60|nr:esterase B1-like [Culex pipiens pallens]